MKRIIFLLAASAIMASCGQEKYRTDEIGITVSPEENREYSYTDKKSGYWYGRTHQTSTEWWSGWNMAKKRILSDYTLGTDGTALDRAGASCVVYPERLVRTWDNAEETFLLIDDMPILYIGLETKADSIFCRLAMDHIAKTETAAEGMILGTAAKMFTIAGPVIVYGVSASEVYGLIH